MAKSALRRHHAERLHKKWTKLSKHLDFIPSLSFGMIFNSDPLDCGNPKCGICSNSKMYSNSRRILRKEEKSSYLEVWQSLE